ncbi:hypothetical protein [Pseudotabrizicola sp. 4114]|uniref:hypothetical protein n=1 Tax=Pseudotabrizicola sp. 4114 TaxID=2817731 RepID=UPI00285771B7|nr:hypothetical protein [Pseudorhodobacter sp. 4114]
MQIASIFWDAGTGFSTKIVAHRVVSHLDERQHGMTSMTSLKALALGMSAVLTSQADGQNRVQTEDLVTGLLAVGGTGIACYMAPCPWRGISQTDSRDRVIWSGNVLPVLIAGTEDRARVAAAWDRYDCLVVDGSYDGTALTIRDIIGPCT